MLSLNQNNSSRTRNPQEISLTPIDELFSLRGDRLQ